jgi:acylphosphatase
MNVKATVTVNGTVRMAGCREHLHRQAGQLGLTGVLEDFGDGRIRIVVEGEKEMVNEFIGSLNEGKCLYNFTGFDIEFVNPEGRYGPFMVAGT